MAAYRAHLRRLDHLRNLAWQEAKRLRSTAMGPEEFLLAISHPEAGDSIAAQALRDCGIDREALTELAEHKASETEIAGGPQFSPAGYQLMSKAEGIAAALGASEVTAEHLLLGYLWDPDHSAWQLEHLGSSRERVRAQLADLGADLPEVEFPAPDPRRWEQRVEVSLEELWVLIRELHYVMPADAHLAFNHDSKKGWISATEGVDLAVYIPRALDRHRRLNLPPNGGQSGSAPLG